MERVALLVSMVGLIVWTATPAIWAQSRLNPAVFRDDPVPARPDWAPFIHGIASGDPLPDRVIIWTRVTPQDDSGDPIEVAWKMARDPQLQEVVKTGKQWADASADYTLKVDVDGLTPGTTYYYGFTALDAFSLTGRTKTAPAGSQANHLRFGVGSCSSFQAGYFNAFHRLAERNDLDAIIYLGDYINEGYRASGDLIAERPVAPQHKLLSLDDYRARYASYRIDTNLIRAHQQHPFIAVWDDHEFADNAYVDGAGNHDPASDGDWGQRKAAARQAYYEWLPIRNETPDASIYRKLSYGNLMDLLLIDTRLEGRDKQIYDPFDPAVQDADRSILGATQKTWLLNQLTNSAAKWKIIAQQVPFAPLELGWSGALDQDDATRYDEIQGQTLDAWNGYPEERRQILQVIEKEAIDNVVILTGSYHVALAFEVTPEPVRIRFEGEGAKLTPYYTTGENYNPTTGEGTLAIEFASPSVTSRNFDENFGAAVALVSQQLINQNIKFPGLPDVGNPNPHLKYVDLIQHGYFLLDVKPDSIQANWYYSTIPQVTDRETFDQAWYSRDGEKHLLLAAGPSPGKDQQDKPAPAEPPSGALTDWPEISESFSFLGAFPNPFKENNTLEFKLQEPAKVSIAVYDISGSLVRLLLDQALRPGKHSLQFNGSDLAEGTYYYHITVNDRSYSLQVIRAR